MQDVISNGQARAIAADWHGGQGSALYALASSGAIVDGVRDEISRDFREAPIGVERLRLLALDKYVTSREDHRPIREWSTLWSNTRVTLDQCYQIRHLGEIVHPGDKIVRKDDAYRIITVDRGPEYNGTAKVLVKVTRDDRKEHFRPFTHAFYDHALGLTVTATIDEDSTS